MIGSSPHLEIRPSPRAVQPLPPRRRKRKHFFDEVVVLTNRYIIWLCQVLIRLLFSLLFVVMQRMFNLQVYEEVTE